MQRDDFVKGSPENPWSEVFDHSRADPGSCRSKIDLFLPAFSTTGTVERAAAEVVLLDAMQSYFDYQVDTLCGIPAITLEGTHEDWKLSPNGHKDSGSSDWNHGSMCCHRSSINSPWLLRATLTSAFWQSIYKFNSTSGGASDQRLDHGFLPVQEGSAKRSCHPSVHGAVWERPGRSGEMLYPGEADAGGRWLFCSSFPSGLSKAPFRWNYLDRFFDMEFLGGFVGVAQDQETFALRPEIGWAVREAPATR